VQRALRGRQRDVHHREVQDHHQLRDANHAQYQPAPSVQATATGAASDMLFTTSLSLVNAPAATAKQGASGRLGLSRWRRRMARRVQGRPARMESGWRTAR
jgi:hypothetical protein